MTLVLLAALTACATSVAAPRQHRRVPLGEWGGEHVGVTVSDAGAHFEFDCASGDITKPLATDAAGEWSITGTLTPESPGPVRIGQEPQPRAAQYTGRIDGQAMTFDITTMETKEKMGPFTVALGTSPNVRKCR